MDFKKSFVSVCFGVLLCIEYGYGEVYYKVILDNDGDNGRLMISSSGAIISGNTSCATGATNCATVPINGGKLSEYMLACVSKMNNTCTFSFDGTKYTFNLLGGVTQFCLTSISFYTDATGINIDILTKGGKSGTIRLSSSANREEQRKVDYMVSLLVDAIDSYYLPIQDHFSTCICFNKSGNIITDLYAWQSEICSSCSP